MIFKFTCKELGQDCNYTAKAADLKEIMIKAIIHEIIAHNSDWQRLNRNIENMNIEAAIKQAS